MDVLNEKTEIIDGLELFFGYHSKFIVSMIMNSKKKINLKMNLNPIIIKKLRLSKFS